MPSKHYSKWDNPSGDKTTCEIGDAEIYQFRSHRELASNHTLDLAIYRTSLRSGCNLSSKLLPVVVTLIEADGKKEFVDFYSFDHKEVLLSHGYSRIGMENENDNVEEAHDLSLDRLVAYSDTIRDMIGGYPVPSTLGMTGIVISLMEGCLRKKS